MSSFTPTAIWPLANYLAEEMCARGWTAIDVAKRMPGEYGHNVGLVNLVLAVQVPNMIIDRRTTEPLAVAFDVSWEMFQNLHDKWVMWPDARQPFECPEHLLTGLLFPENDSVNIGEPHS